MEWSDEGDHILGQHKEIPFQIVIDKKSLSWMIGISGENRPRRIGVADGDLKGAKQHSLASLGDLLATWSYEILSDLETVSRNTH